MSNYWLENKLVLRSKHRLYDFEMQNFALINRWKKGKWAGIDVYKYATTEAITTIVAVEAVHLQIQEAFARGDKEFFVG